MHTGSGSIDARELAQIFKAQGQQLSLQDVQELIDEVRLPPVYVYVDVDVDVDVDVGVGVGVGVGVHVCMCAYTHVRQAHMHTDAVVDFFIDLVPRPSTPGPAAHAN